MEKLNLKELKVTSFTTTISAQQTAAAKGGFLSIGANCSDNCGHGVLSIGNQCSYRATGCKGEVSLGGPDHTKPLFCND